MHVCVHLPIHLTLGIHSIFCLILFGLHSSHLDVLNLGFVVGQRLLFLGQELVPHWSCTVPLDHVLHLVEGGRELGKVDKVGDIDKRWYGEAGYWCDQNFSDEQGQIIIF